MKISIFQLISWGFLVKSEINKAYADDNTISAKEMLSMYKTLSQEIKLPVDEKVQNALDLVSELIDELALITDDNKVSVAEIVSLAEKICERMGIDLDKTSFDIPEIGKTEE